VLSLHFLDEDTHKILDYLLRNFHIHHYEAENIIIYFMHYHSTPFYTRFLQNIVLKTREHFGFLHTPISKGDLILRETIAKQINHDSHILASLIAYNIKVSTKLLNVQSNGQTNNSQG
jgi:U3 small nucleolar RNA-associated protein 10